MPIISLGDIALKKKRNIKDYSKKLIDLIVDFHAVERAKRATRREKEALTKAVYLTLKELKKLK